MGIAFTAWPLIITQAQSQTKFSYQGRIQSLFNGVSSMLILSFYGLIGCFGKNFNIANLYWLEIFIMFVSLTLIVHYKKIVE